MDDFAVWRTELRSPDGAWLASAETLQTGGFGSADIWTVVHLQQAFPNSHKTVVISIGSQGPIPHPYTLDNIANKGGSIGLAMTWVGPKRLVVKYAKQPGTVVNFQAVKLDGVEIELQALAGR